MLLLIRHVLNHLGTDVVAMVPLWCWAIGVFVLVPVVGMDPHCAQLLVLLVLDHYGAVFAAVVDSWIGMLLMAHHKFC
jgi:hypothetical protein